VRRIPMQPRARWQQTVESQGLLWHSGAQPYWNEAACYEFSSSEVDSIEAVTGELHGMCLKAVRRVIDQKRYRDFGIPAAFDALIEAAWEAEPPSLYGRFDLAYSAKGQLKLLEYNADTPTSLLEAAVIQWYWLEDQRKLHPRRDQFNSIHEKLIALWKLFRPYLNGTHIHFTSADDVEDGYTVAYLQDTAQQAGYTTSAFPIGELGYHEAEREFRDPEERVIHTLFKLYPWEWIANEPGGGFVKTDAGRTTIIEPVWKMLLSNKAILAVLWELYPGHLNLLATALDTPPPGVHSWVRKPKMSREGNNITIYENGAAVLSTDGDYGEEGYVCQELLDIAAFNGQYPVLGSWVIGHEDDAPAGVGIRESATRVTGNTSQFVPHWF
jgi:glutathionylspermidine synthase